MLIPRQSLNQLFLAGVITTSQVLLMTIISHFRMYARRLRKHKWLGELWSLIFVKDLNSTPNYLRKSPCQFGEFGSQLSIKSGNYANVLPPRKANPPLKPSENMASRGILI